MTQMEYHKYFLCTPEIVKERVYVRVHHACVRCVCVYVCTRVRIMRVYVRVMCGEQGRLEGIGGKERPGYSTNH